MICTCINVYIPSRIPRSMKEGVHKLSNIPKVGNLCWNWIMETTLMEIIFCQLSSLISLLWSQTVKIQRTGFALFGCKYRNNYIGCSIWLWNFKYHTVASTQWNYSRISIFFIKYNWVLLWTELCLPKIKCWSSSP